MSKGIKDTVNELWIINLQSYSLFSLASLHHQSLVSSPSARSSPFLGFHEAALTVHPSVPLLLLPPLCLLCPPPPWCPRPRALTPALFSSFLCVIISIILGVGDSQTDPLRGTSLLSSSSVSKSPEVSFFPEVWRVPNRLQQFGIHFCLSPVSVKEATSFLSLRLQIYIRVLPCFPPRSLLIESPIYLLFHFTTVVWTVITFCHNFLSLELIRIPLQLIKTQL